MKEKIKEGIISLLKTIIYAVLIALIINNLIVVNATVPTGSMENTIMTGDRIIAFRMAYILSSPKRGDIVVFKYPDNEEVLYVKRIIGLPEDTILLKDGKLFINGEDAPYLEPYIKDIDYSDYGPYKVPYDSYFMMGDNRLWSEDSRYWENKFVHKDKILGKVIFKYYRDFKAI